MVETTINKSILNKNNFRLLIDKVPTVEYYVQGVNIPGLSFTETVAPAGVGLDAYYPGDKVSFDTLNVTFLVDEDLQNYKEIYDWMNAIVPIHDPDDFANLTGSKKTTDLRSTHMPSSDLAQETQITLVTNTNKNIANKYFRFHDAFPISLGGLELLSGSETEPVICEVQFRFTYYELSDKS